MKSSPASMPAQICPLANLPGEILREIAQHLDLRSSSHLARTCHGFQDLGESRVWAELMIPPQHAVTAVQDHRQLTTAEAITAFQSRQVRTSFLQRISITPTTNFHEVSILLDLVKESITELELCDSVGPWFDETKLDEGYEHLLKPLGVGALPRLQALTIPLGGLWCQCAIDLLAASPRLEVLVIYNGVNNNSDLPVVTVTKPDVPIMPNLRVLMVRKVMEEYVPWMVRLIERSPSLGQALLWTNHAQQTEVWWTGITDALRQLPALWGLTTDQRIPLDFTKRGFDHLRELSLGRLFDGCGAYLLDVSKIVSSKEAESPSFR